MVLESEGDAPTAQACRRGKSRLLEAGCLAQAGAPTSCRRQWSHRDESF